MRLSKQQLEDLFVTAFEGGSSYWAAVKDETPKNGSNSYSESWFKHIWEGGSMDVYDAEDDDELLGVVTKDRLIAAAKEMMDNDFDHLDIKDYDAESADVWFQFAALGEYTFG